MTGAASSSPQILDSWISACKFSERHSIEVEGSIEAIRAAIRELRPGEIPLVRFLLRLRNPFGPRATSGKPILDAAQSERFVVLEDTPDELVMGLAGRFWTPSAGRVRLESPEAFREFETTGYAKAAVNFRIDRIEGKPNRFRITTETRIVTFGRAATLKFGAYWWIAVRWGSGWIRMLWLKAIRKRVEGRR